MNTTQTEPKKMSLGAMIFGHAVMLIFFVGFPALVTAAAPLSVTRFWRTDDGVVSAHASTRLLYVIPFRQTRVEGVTAVSDHFSAGSVNRSRSGSGGSTHSVQSEDSAFLVIEGASDSAHVEVSPVNAARTLAKAQRFLDDPGQRHLRLITVANWKFGVFAGGFVSLLTVFYIFIWANTLLNWLRRLITGRDASAAPGAQP